MKKKRKKERKRVYSLYPWLSVYGNFLWFFCEMCSLQFFCADFREPGREEAAPVKYH